MLTKLEQIKKAQSSLEYIIVLAAIIAAVILGAAAFAPRNGTVGLGKLMNATARNMSTSTTQMVNQMLN